METLSLRYAGSYPGPVEPSEMEAGGASFRLKQRAGDQQDRDKPSHYGLIARPAGG